MDNKNDTTQPQNSQQGTSDVNSSKAGQSGGSETNDPSDRMQDGTNDFKNGDQEPSSEASSKQ